MSFSVQEIVGLIQSVQGLRGRVVNEEDLGAKLHEIRVDRPVSLGGAKPNELTFFFSKMFQHELPSACPGILITGEAFVQPMKAAGLPFWKTTAIIACSDPYLAMAVLSERFAESLSSVAHSPLDSDSSKAGASFIHPAAVVSPDAEIAQGVQIGAYCVIEKGVKIGAGTILYPHCYVGERCTLGESVVLFPRVTLYEWTQIGNRVRIHSGATLGADGFGYAPRKEDSKVVDHQKIYHLGRVVVEDDVEIGANTAVDRGTFSDTRIAKKAKIDNLVQVGHNVRIDEGAIICGGVCLAGNAHIGKFVYIGGIAGVVNHIHIGDGAMVGACTLVTKDVPAGGTAAGNPQREHKEHFRAHAVLSKMLDERRKK